MTSLSVRQLQRLVFWGERICRDNAYDWGNRDVELYLKLKEILNDKVNGTGKL